MEHATYLPAAGRDWALPLYDTLVRLLGIDSTRSRLIEQAALRPGHSVLDVGCGTGSLAVMIKQRHADVDVVAIDPDPRALARAQRKAAGARASVRFDRGYARELPYRDASFDCVLSTFMFHHLEPEEQDAMVRQVRRVLKPGGAVHLVDFAPGDTTGDGRIARRLHAHHRVRGNEEDRLLAMFERAGLAEAVRVAEPRLRFGIRIASYRSVRPR